MKKLIALLSLVMLIGTPMITLAVNYGEAPEIFQDETDLIAKINEVTNWVFTGLLALAGIFLIVAGYSFVTAGGNPEGVNKGRQMLINALIGVAIGLGAKGLIAVITNFLQP
jgi:hypothetical protein